MVPKNVFRMNLDLARHYRMVPGDIIECGTWKGGMIGAIAKMIGGDKTYYLIDSFEGLPEAKDIDGKAAKEWQQDKKSKYYYDNCKADESDARKAMSLSGVDNFIIVKGWFEEVLPDIKPKNGFSIIRLDGDWYDSTYVSLEHLFPLLNSGGIVIIDDYNAWEGCARAVHDYVSKNNIAIRIKEFHNKVTYIVKP